MYRQNNFVLSEDTSFQQGKLYYRRYDTGSATDPYIYRVAYETIPGTPLPVPNNVYYECIDAPIEIDETDPIIHNSFMFIRTENEQGEAIWRQVADDNAEDIVIKIRNELFGHVEEDDPHHQYLKKNEVRNYIKEIINNPYILPTADWNRLGGVFLALTSDVYRGRPGALAVTADVLHSVLTQYSTTDHNHKLENLENIDGTPTTGQGLVYDATEHVWIPMDFGSNTPIISLATHTSRGLVELATSSDVQQGKDNARVVNGALLSSTLRGYRN